jgi:hypothetical protein
VAALHKLITGGEQWLAFAKSKLQTLVSLGLEYASQHFTMPDGADVQVRIASAQHFIRIDGGASYEFFTSEPIFPSTASTGEYTGGESSFGVTGSSIRMVGQSPSALFSTFLTPPVPPRWVLRDKDFSFDTYAKPISENFRSRYAWQKQKFFEYVTWPGNGNKSMVTSTQGMSPGRNTMANWDSPYRESALNSQYAWLHDEGNDVPPAYYDAKGAQAGTPLYTDMDRIWSRHAAVQSAGGRKFFICTDNFGRFQVYPMKAYPLDGNGIPFATSYWLETPPYPAWVTVPNPADTDVRLNEWLWAFNKDSTKAVSCPFNSVATDLLIIKEPTNKAPDLQYGLRMNLALHSSEAGGLPVGAETIPGRHDTPGLVEFGIEITVTGEGEMDFTVAFTLLRNQYALTDNRYFFDAAYSLPPKGDNDLMPWTEDTLVTAEVQMFVAPGNYAEGPIAHYAGGTPAVFKQNANMPVGFVVLCTNDADMVPNERIKLQATANDGGYLTTTGFVENFTTGFPTAGVYVGMTDNYGNVRSYRPASYGSMALGPDPCVPSALALVSTPTYAGVEPTSFIHLRSLELRTMSLQYDVFDYRTGFERRVMVAYNEEVFNFARGILPVGTGPDRAVLNTERVPCSAVAHHNAIINWAFWTQPGRGFSIHPAGHWSHSAGASEQSDIVNTKTGKSRSRRTSHKALFNKAFGQERDYSYYIAPNPGTLTELNYKEYLAYYFGYMGGFRTNGVWMTF